MESPIAKATFVKKQRFGKIYWQRADLKWHRYEPTSEVKTIEEFLKVVEEDDFCCFGGVKRLIPKVLRKTAGFCQRLRVYLTAGTSPIPQQQFLLL